MLISSVMEITPRLIFIRMIIICLWGAKVIQSDIKSKNGMIFIIDGFIDLLFFRQLKFWYHKPHKGFPSNFNRNMLRESLLLWLWLW
jgi:hypothetical protein